MALMLHILRFRSLMIAVKVLAPRDTVGGHEDGGVTPYRYTVTASTCQCRKGNKILHVLQTKSQNDQMATITYCSRNDLCSDSNIFTIWHVSRNLKISCFHMFYFHDRFPKYFF